MIQPSVSIMHTLTERLIKYDNISVFIIENIFLNLTWALELSWSSRFGEFLWSFVVVGADDGLFVFDEDDDDDEGGDVPVVMLWIWFWIMFSRFWATEK